ncbi:MAG: matrixin family metalloprotease [Acidobacteria bacterium]|nr:matrixin family metalloprotease [Acidobacteriota bacterium]
MTARVRLVAVAALALAALAPAPLLAYLKLGFQVGSRTVTLHWVNQPTRYSITNSGVPSVTPSQFQSAVAAAFSTWEQVPSARFSGTFAGFTGARPFEDDGISVLGYASRPDLDRVLAATTFIINTTTGEIVESDIFFNSAFGWSTAQAGEPNRFDVQSIALHEIGHLLGLGHSALGETELRAAGGRRVIAAGAVMFPIAFSAGNVEERVLQADDIAGVSDIYPDGTFRTHTGSISGRVTKNGAGVYGAHVVAFNLQTGQMVGNFALSDTGAFAIAGLEPGAYAVRVEPLDDADLESFFDSASKVDAAFAPKFYERIVVAPRGGGSGEIEITVSAR